jgi:crossover junction endodeoxyribonuclease RuvC
MMLDSIIRLYPTRVPTHAGHHAGRRPAGRRPVAGGESPTVVVLGIDPGLASTGYGVVARRGGRLLALDGGVIATRAELAPERRLAEIHRAVDALLDEHQPDAVALEQLYFGQNVRTAFAVGQARGVVLLAAGQHGLPCAGYTPQQVKGAVCGSGRAHKDQVARMVQALLGLTEQPRPDHAADALAVAVCHVNCAPLAMALAGAPAVVGG